MIGSASVGYAQPVQSGSIESQVAALGSQMDELGASIVSLESSLHQVLSVAQDSGESTAPGKPCPSTPLASKLSNLNDMLRNLSNRIHSIRGRVDI